MPGRSLHPASLCLWAETQGTATPGRPGEKGWVSSSAQLLPHSGTLVGRVMRWLCRPGVPQLQPHKMDKGGRGSSAGGRAPAPLPHSLDSLHLQVGALSLIHI